MGYKKKYDVDLEITLLLLSQCLVFESERFDLEAFLEQRKDVT